MSIHLMLSGALLRDNSIILISSLQDDYKYIDHGDKIHEVETRGGNIMEMTPQILLLTSGHRVKLPICSFYAAWIPGLG